MARKSLRERNQVTIGIVGLVVAGLLLFASLNVGMIRGLFGEATYEAHLSDTGGLRAGDPVRVDGRTVGSVSSLALEDSSITVSFRAGGDPLGDETRVTVKSENALGSKYLEVEPGGSGDVPVIPLERTDPGYAVSEVLGRLTSTVSEIDTERLAQSFESLTTVLDATPEEFASALEGVSSLSQTISARDAELAQLLQDASSLSAVLADRNEQLTDLMAQGTRVFDEIVARRDLVARLFGEVGRAAGQFRALAEENAESFRPALEEIDHFAQILAEYRDNLDYYLQTFPAYARSLGEAVGSGPFFHAYVTNLLAPESLLSVDNIVQDALNQNAGE